MNSPDKTELSKRSSDTSELSDDISSDEQEAKVEFRMQVKKEMTNSLHINIIKEVNHRLETNQS